MVKKLRKILLVEDDRFLLSLYSAKFVAEGFAVAGALTAAEALTEAQSFKPDLILLDIMLPDEDGLSVLKKLKRGKGTANLPIVILSNLSEPTYREQALIYGAVDYWIKAYLEPSEVVEKVKHLLK
jgi:DNA-binding response OmpR family regulator